MKKTISLGLLLLLAVWLTGCGQRPSTFYQPYAGKGDREYRADGIASWYGRPFHGRRTASGERYDMNKLTAAHRTLPFGAHVRVTNLANDESVVVMINDRGPFAKNRLIDLSRAAARQLGFESTGTTHVRLEWIEDPSDHPDATEIAEAEASAGDLIAQEIDKELEQAE